MDNGLRPHLKGCQQLHNESRGGFTDMTCLAASVVGYWVLVFGGNKRIDGENELTLDLQRTF